MVGSRLLRAGILGASGYTGAELVRLLARHPGVEIGLLTADRKAGAELGAVFPHLAVLGLGPMVGIDDVDWAGVDLDVVFCGLPHGTTQDVIAGILAARPDVRIVDLSADFRLRDIDSYAEWYGQPHRAPHLQGEAVYALTEFARAALRNARLAACPGCYPTGAQLPLRPLLEAGLIEPDDIIIDAKSGVTGAGRAAKEGNLYAEVDGGIHAYGVAGHRHMPEIEQGLGDSAGRPVIAGFTPHLMPMARGILSTIYVRLAGGADAAALQAALAGRYDAEPFVHVLPLGAVPATRHVRGSNHCIIGVSPDRLPGRAILISAIDNLVKGASGQAVQAMNVMFGLDETAGLDQLPLFP